MSDIVTFQKTSKHGKLPSRGSNGAAGIDIPLPMSVTILAGQKVSVDLCLSVQIPEGFYGQLALRSSTAVLHRLLLHGGVIDRYDLKNFVEILVIIYLSFSDYSGSVICILENIGKESVGLIAGLSYVQLLVIKNYNGPIYGGLDYQYPTERGDGCFGSTEERQQRLNVENIVAYNVEKQTTADENDSG